MTWDDTMFTSDRDAAGNNAGICGCCVSWARERSLPYQLSTLSPQVRTMPFKESRLRRKATG